MDEIASVLGVEDKDPRVRWEYSQAETRGQPGVVVQIDVVKSSLQRIGDRV